MERFPGSHRLRRLRDIASKKPAAALRISSRRPTFELLEDRRVFDVSASIVASSIFEGGASQGVAARTGNLSQPLTVFLTSSDTTQATVPNSVVIPANASSVNFTVTAVDDNLLDDPVQITITATAADHASGADGVTINDADAYALAPGRSDDSVNLTPNGQPNQFDVTSGPTPIPLLGQPQSVPFSQNQLTAANVTTYGNKFIPIDLSKTYALSGWAKSGDEFGERFDPNNRQSFGFAAYDANFTLLPWQLGVAHNFAALDSQPVPGDWTWTQYTGIVAGHALPAGTAYVTSVAVLNEHGPGNFITWRDVTITEVPAGTTPAQLAPPIVDLTTPTAGDDRRSIPLAGQSTPLVKVNLNERYSLSTIAVNASEVDERPLGFASYDVDKKLIHPLHVTRFEYAADTTLLASLAPGDTSLLIANASGWSNEAWGAAASRSLAWYGYADGAGHTYADYTYTRNVAVDFDDGLWAPGAIYYDGEAGGYRIPLNKPWSGPTIAAGAAIRNADSGSVNNLPEVSVGVDPFQRRAEYAATVGGGSWLSGQRNDAAFRPGTAYIQPLFSLAVTNGAITVAPQSDAVFGTPLDPTKQPLALNVAGQAPLTLDVLAKQPFGPGANVVIDSMHAELGIATIAANAGAGGRDAILYTSPSAFVGTDVVRYTLRDVATGQTLQLSAAISVLGGELVATGTLRSFIRDVDYSTATGKTLNADRTGALGVMDAASNGPSGSTVRLIAGAAHGTLELNPDGTFIYTPQAGFAGVDQFRYEALTTSGVYTATASIRVYGSEEELAAVRLNELGRGVTYYESAKGRFPLDGSTADHYDASGNPHLSWRVHILPYIGYQSLYSQFRLNEAWNSAHNAPLAAKMPDIFRSAGDAPGGTTTRFQTVSGEGAPYYWRRLSNGRLVGPRASDIDDGLSDTLLFVESAPDRAVTWTRPDDLDFNPAHPLAALGNLAGMQNINAVTADGVPLVLSTSIDPATFAKLVTVSGGELVDAATLRREYAESHGGPAAVQAYDAPARIDNNFKQLWFGMMNYEQALGRLPLTMPRSYFDANGVPYLSWRVHLLPYMEQQDLYSKFKLDEPWNSAHNLPLLDEMPDFFRSTGDASDSTSTRVMTFYGAGTPFKPAEPGTSTSVGGTRLRDVEPGTILILEAGANRAVPWTSPAEMPFNPADPLAPLGDLSRGIRIVTAEGSVFTLPSDVTPQTLAALATNLGGELLDAAGIAARERARQGNFVVNAYADLNKFKQVAIGMLNHESARARLPANSFDAAGKPLLSWRVHILPYIGHGALYNQFRKNEPWDSSHNLALLDQMPDVFRTVGDPWNSSTTQITTFIGPGSPFPATGTNTTQGTRLSNITDGTSSTIGLVEAGRDHAVPWTKPSDTPFNPNNPLSALGDIGPNFLTAMLDGSVQLRPASMSPAQLAALITHQGNEDANNPPPIVFTQSSFVHQSGGDSSMNEFGVEWFDVVLDKAPLTNLTLALGISGAAAALDRSSLTFTPQTWNVPQRVAIRAVDNQVFNADRTLTFTVSSKSFNVLIRDDDLAPPLAADFNGDHVVDGSDVLAWQRNLGTPAGAAKSQGDADADGLIDANDLRGWRQLFGTGAPADFNFDGAVNATDLAAWGAGFGRLTAAAAGQGDANHDGAVDGADFLAWQRRLSAPTPATIAAIAAADSTAAINPLAVFAPTTDLLMGLATPLLQTMEVDEDFAEALASGIAKTSEPIPLQARATAFAAIPAYRATEEDLVDFTPTNQSLDAVDESRLIDEALWSPFSE